MTDTIAVLALDAADTDLIERFECDNLKLDRYHQIESFAYGHDVPVTWEVWPAVATANHPSDMNTVEMKWDNPILAAVQKVTKHLPMRWRRWLGSPFRQEHVSSFKQVNVECVFDSTPNWPGCSEARDLKQSWQITELSAKGKLTRVETYDRLVEQFGSQLGWLAAAAERNAGVVGIHSHILDSAGHLFAEDEVEYSRYYEKVDSMVAEKLDTVDRLLILSDHGMQTMFNNDPDPGKHSWRSVAATNIDDTLPSDMFSVKSWLKERSTAYNVGEKHGRDDEVIQRLEDLGYA